jgi:hypothetical protein
MEATSTARARAYWGTDAMIETIVDAMCGMILAPVHAALPRSASRGRARERSV